MERNSFFQRASTLVALLSALTVVHCSEGTIKNECAKDTDCKVSGDTCDPVDHVCKPKVCTPKTCGELGKECGGPYADGCGAGGVVNCPECVAPETCNRNTGMCQAGCLPDCGVRECGLDPVCGTKNCGTCRDPATCAVDTGMCETPCVPKTCAELGKECGGPYDDGCFAGGVVNCPECIAPEICKRDTGMCQPDDGSSAGRIGITIDHTKVADDLSDFPLLVHLSGSSGIDSADVSFVFDALESDANRKKIAVTTADGSTACYVEIERWDTAARQAWLWVRVPKISASADTDLYLSYDRDRLDNTDRVGDVGSTAAQNVWIDSFVAVLHLDQDGNGTSGEFKDSTGCHHDGTGGGDGETPYGAGSAPTQTSSVVGNGQRFNGDTDYITIPGSDDFSQPTTGYITVSWWFTPTVLRWRHDSGDGHYINFFGKGGYPDGWEWTFTLGGEDSSDKAGEIAYYIHSASGGEGAGGGIFHVYDVGDRLLFVGRLNDKRVNVVELDEDYDGTFPLREDVETESDFDYYASYGVVPINTWSPVTIGSIVTQWQMFEGLIDEVRISNTWLSDEWLRTAYYSDRDELVYFTTP